jgi:hypothetical protein
MNDIHDKNNMTQKYNNKQLPFGYVYILFGGNLPSAVIKIDSFIEKFVNFLYYL